MSPTRQLGPPTADRLPGGETLDRASARQAWKAPRARETGPLRARLAQLKNIELQDARSGDLGEVLTDVVPDSAH
jgi:hypothetical protein